MNKEEFLQKLEALLSDVDAAERREAILYYEEYFQDSEKAEEEVVRELGSPQEVAHSIREELAEKEIVPSSGITDEAQKQKDSKAQNVGGTGTGQKKKTEPWVVVLLVLAVIFVGIPMGVPLLATVFGIFCAAVCTILGVLLAAIVCAVVFAVAAVISLIVCAAKLFAAPLVALILLGLSLILLGLCFLSALAAWKLCTVVIPATIRGFVYLCRLPFRKKKQEATI